jgi:hypothetical protein
VKASDVLFRPPVEDAPTMFPLTRKEPSPAADDPALAWL